MTEADLERIESCLSIELPTWFRELMLKRPDLISKGFCCDADELIKINLDNREECDPPYWWKTHFMLRGEGGSWAVIRLDGTDGIWTIGYDNKNGLEEDGGTIEEYLLRYFDRPPPPVVTPQESLESPILKDLLGKWLLRDEDEGKESREWPDESENTLEMTIDVGHLTWVKKLAPRYLEGLQSRLRDFPMHLYRPLWQNDLANPVTTWNGVFEVLDYSESNSWVRFRVAMLNSVLDWQLQLDANRQTLTLSRKEYFEKRFNRPGRWEKLSSPQ